MSSMPHVYPFVRQAPVERMTQAALQQEWSVLKMRLKRIEEELELREERKELDPNVVRNIMSFVGPPVENVSKRYPY